ncbi:protein phosphatase [Cordyceps fumosorosea ARSEF 2679]|uniref:Protein phosphatase n=1 Tax=Cordyceps fumosorosea (strain ARSEF 2679) TaxID=1081104 RepID=A0A167RPB4_CORFA|nr:protein phosphatase [Cordyceps fumosorosea ARSEF 2679]OAA58795.1 protein phosphatase [Cordyceps fumosorosea ARSEF 2679]
MEAKKVIENVQGINGGQAANGTLRLTDYHFVFCAPVGPPADTSAAPPKTRERWLTYPTFSHCTFRPTPPGSIQAASIRIRCRDFTFVTFNFANNEVAKEVFEFIKARTCRLGTVERLFAFSHKPLKNEREVNGWHIYDPKAEFRRQGISEKLPDKGWRITHINKDYTFCDTYPAVLVVPSKISDNVLKYAKDFRSRCRIPTLSYIHPINNCTITRSSQPLSGITRKTNVQDEKLVAASFSVSVSASSESTTPMSSQLDVSSAGSSNAAELSDSGNFEPEIIAPPVAMYDEKTGKRLVYGAQQSNLIVDARPTINAVLNQVQGMGSENMDKYKFATKIFLNIANIHVMRSSLNKVVEALKDADISPLPPSRELLHQSSWLKHIGDVLKGSDVIAEQVGIRHSHVLIHCSDGWDRTSQLSALSQIMLDPYYRTIEGFVVLVEKDWLSFGHMFRLRSGHLNHDDWFLVQRDAFAGTRVNPGENDGRNDAFQNVISGAKRFFNQSKEEDEPDVASEAASGKVVDEEATTPKMVSPVFHQFLDCTYQLIRQHKNRFEYNERFLRRLLYHLYSCQYGTFLYNSEKQRVDAKVMERTSSVWDYFLCRKQEFTNPDYDPTVDDRLEGKERIIRLRPQDIRWWYQAFGRTDDEMNATLDATALSENERRVAVSRLHNSEIASPSPKSPSLGTSKSVLTGVDISQDLTPANQSLRRSVSAEDVVTNPSLGAGAFAALRDGIANINIGKGVFANTSTEAAGQAGANPKPDQEMQEMT